MRLTIIPSDGAVYKDSQSHSGLDLSFCPSNVHALQWYENYGEIEYKRQFVDGQIIHPQNELISSLPEWATNSLAIWETEELKRLEVERLAAEAQLLADQNGSV